MSATLICVCQVDSCGDRKKDRTAAAANIERASSEFMEIEFEVFLGLPFANSFAGSLLPACYTIPAQSTDHKRLLWYLT